MRRSWTTSLAVAAAGALVMPCAAGAAFSAGVEIGPGGSAFGPPPEIGFGQTGAAVVMYEGPAGIWAATAPSAAGAFAATNLGAGGRGSLAVAANGAAVIAWRASATSVQVHYRPNAGAAFSSAATFAGTSVGNVAAGIDSDGDAVVVWKDTKIRYALSTGATFGAATDADPLGANPGFDGRNGDVQRDNGPRAFRDDLGNVLLAYRNANNPTIAHRSTGGTWTSTVLTGGPSTDIKADADPASKRLIVGYIGGGTFRAFEGTTTGLTGSVVVQQPASNSASASASVRRGGSEDLVTWQTSTALMSAGCVDGFAPQTVVSSPNVSSAGSGLTSGRESLAGWTQSSSALGLHGASRVVGGAWSGAPTLLSGDNGGGAGAGANYGGGGMVAYVRTSGTNNVQGFPYQGGLGSGAQCAATSGAAVPGGGTDETESGGGVTAIAESGAPIEEPGQPPSLTPSGPATSISLLLGGRVLVLAGGARGVQVRTDGTCDARLAQSEGQALFKRIAVRIRKAGTYILPITLTSRGEREAQDAKKPVKVKASLACDPTRYAAADFAGFGAGTPTVVSQGARTPVELGLIDPDADPGGVPPEQQFRVRWRAPAPAGGGATVSFDVVDNKHVENFQVTGGVATCYGTGGVQSGKKADFLEFQTERIPIDRYAQADLFKRLAVPGDAIRQAQVHINFNESSVGKDNAGGTVKFDFRAGEGGCGLLVNFNAKPERIEVPPAQRVEYGGRTERGGEVTFNLAAGKRIDDLRIEVHVQCRGSSDIFGQKDFTIAELFTANTIPVKDGRFDYRGTSPTGDSLRLFGSVVTGKVEGRVLAARTLTTGTSDFVTCSTPQELTFSAKPGKPEKRSDRDADGVLDDDDKCPTLSDAGNPRRQRDGCPAGRSDPGATNPSALGTCRAGARAAQNDGEKKCTPQDVLDSYKAYARTLTDSVVEQYRLTFVEITIGALASDEDRGALVAFGRDIYAAYRLPLRNLVYQSIVITDPPQIAEVTKALVSTKDHLGQGDPSTFGVPNCAAFRPPRLVEECKKAYHDLVQSVCDAALELYRIKYDLAHKRLLPGSDWTQPSGRFGPVGPEERCNVPPIP